MAIDFLESYKRGTDMQSRDLMALKDLYAQQAMAGARFKREDEAVARENKRYEDKLSYDLAAKENEILEEADRRNKQFAIDRAKLEKQAIKDKAEADYKAKMLSFRELEVKNKSRAETKPAYDLDGRMKMEQIRATSQILQKDWENKVKKYDEYTHPGNKKQDVLTAQKLAAEVETARKALENLGATQNPLKPTGSGIAYGDIMPISGQLSGGNPTPAPAPASTQAASQPTQAVTKTSIKEWIKANYPNERQNWPTIFKQKMQEYSSKGVIPQ